MNESQSLDNTQDTAPESPVSQQPVSETVAETLSRSLAEFCLLYTSPSPRDS